MELSRNLPPTTPSPTTTDPSRSTSEEVPPPPPPDRRWSSDSFDRNPSADARNSGEFGGFTLSMFNSRESDSKPSSGSLWKNRTIVSVDSNSEKREEMRFSDGSVGGFNLDDVETVNKRVEELVATHQEALRECNYLVNLYTSFTVDDYDSKKLLAAIAKLKKANDDLSNASDQHDAIVQESDKLLIQANDIIYNLRMKESADRFAAETVKNLFSPSDEKLQEIKFQVTAAFKREDSEEQTFSLPKEMLRRETCFLKLQHSTEKTTAHALHLAKATMDHLDSMGPFSSSSSKLLRYIPKYAQLAQEDYKKAQMSQKQGDWELATSCAQSAIENVINIVIAREMATYGKESKLLLTLKKGEGTLEAPLQPISTDSSSNHVMI